MSDQAIQNAMSKRESLAKEINSLQAELAELRKDLARVDQFIADWNAFAGINSPASNTPPATKNPAREAVGNEAAAIIHAANRPVSRKDLFEALESRGLSIYGKDPEMVLSTMMWRMQDKFVRIPNAGYWFRDRPCPAVGYKPGDIAATKPKTLDDLENQAEDLLG